MDDLSIPEFLKRNKDGTFLHPATMACAIADAITAPVVERLFKITVDLMSDTELQALAEGGELTLVDRQPIYMELRAREDKKKAYARIAEMKAKKNETSNPT